MWVARDRSDESSAASSSSSQSSPLETEQLYFAGRVATYGPVMVGGGGTRPVSCGATAAGVGRCGTVSYGRGPPGAAGKGHRVGRDSAAASGAVGFGGPLLAEATSLQSALTALSAFKRMTADEASPGEHRNMPRLACMRLTCEMYRYYPAYPDCHTWPRSHRIFMVNKIVW